MDQVNKRNTETVEMVLKQQNAKIQEQQIRIDNLSNSISGLVERLQALETMLVMQKVKMTGSGPSVK